MAKQIGEDTKVTLDLKTIGMAAAGLAAFFTVFLFFINILKYIKIY